MKHFQSPILGTKLICFTGLARSGKDTFCELFTKSLEEYLPNNKTETFSFAYFLRQELLEFVSHNLNLSVWTEDDEEKKTIRPILVAYGNARRNLSNNTHWVDQLNKKVMYADSTFSLLSDLRFDETDNDELSWLQKNGGLHIHLDRYTVEKGKKKYQKAPNDSEKENNPRLKKAADKVIRMEVTEDLADFRSAAKTICDELVLENWGFLNS